LNIKKIFVALGNNRPRILVELEDCVLRAIIAISKGTPTDMVVDLLHSQIQSLQKDLGEDVEALNWFKLADKDILTTLTPPPSEIPTTPLQGV
jgi:hypothetical protein